MAVIGLVVFLTACAGPSLRYKRSLHKTIASAKYDKAIKKIEDNKHKEYGEKNALLYYLDIGLAYHDANDYPQSEKYFDEAELIYDDLQTKSISRGLGTLLINDATTKYFSPAYEKVLLHVFRALNYAYDDNLQEALVEVRKLMNFLTALRDRYGGRSGIYKDDALAQYLSALLYSDFKQFDDARISLEDAQR
ncbi:MAG TPA: hypothetical protein VMW66_04050, partial [Elusimicrobiales bacterium]|nr:hypothetical protein [Elusimicrobiales bacterium]